MTKSSTTVTTKYDAESLQKLEMREQIRLRPAMWIGSNGTKGLHHLIHEIVDNSIDEFLAGHGDKIDVHVSNDNWVTVRDYGRGIPVEKRKDGQTGLEMVLTTVGGGGKYGGENSGYKVSGGLHGVGSSVVNFVSISMKATVSRDGYEWHQTYTQGIPDGPVTKDKKTKRTGTEISWLFDAEVFSESGLQYERDIVERRLRELTYLNPGLVINLDFHGNKETFEAKGGLSDFMKALVANRDSVKASHASPVLLGGEATGQIEKEGKQVEDTTVIDVALFWTDSQNENSHSYTNSINNPEGGTHYDGFRRGLRKAIQEVAEELGKLRVKDGPFEQSDTREGLFAAIAVKVSDPQFEGQTKGKLNNPEVEKRVADFVCSELKTWMLAKGNKAQAESIIARVIEARDGRLAARKAKKAVTERKGLLGSGGLPGKLADCLTRDREKTEIFLVEGDSAGGSMKNARDRQIQAVLPLRGKIKNAEKAGESTLDSDAIRDILSAIGGSVIDVKVKVEKNGKTRNRTKLTVDVTKPRYSSIIIATDADVDGGHIATLLLTFFYRFMPDLLKGGHIYIAEMPLFRVDHKKLGRHWVYSDAELRELIDKDKVKKRANGEPVINRFKGLGEMNEVEIKETALNPETRRLRQIVIEDDADAEDVTTLLMGSQVARRREYIEENALKVEADV